MKFNNICSPYNELSYLPLIASASEIITRDDCCNDGIYIDMLHAKNWYKISNVSKSIFNFFRYIWFQTAYKWLWGHHPQPFEKLHYQQLVSTSQKWNADQCWSFITRLTIFKDTTVSDKLQSLPSLPSMFHRISLLLTANQYWNALPIAILFAQNFYCMITGIEGCPW